VDEIRYTSLGGVDVKVTKSTQGVSVEIDVKRPREPGETFEQAAALSASIAANAYKMTVEQLAEIGLVPGKDAK
jgi:hypothetical protein